VTYAPTLEQVEHYLRETLQPGDAVLFLGAGNLNRVIPRLLEFYQPSDPLAVG